MPHKDRNPKELVLNEDMSTTDFAPRVGLSNTREHLIGIHNAVLRNKKKIGSFVCALKAGKTKR